MSPIFAELAADLPTPDKGDKRHVITWMHGEACVTSSILGPLACSPWAQSSSRLLLHFVNFRQLPDEVIV